MGLKDCLSEYSGYDLVVLGLPIGRMATLVYFGFDYTDVVGMRKYSEILNLYNPSTSMVAI
jgi:hypothetical protein